MKKRNLITSFSLALLVLFPILFQSIHSYDHSIKQLSEKQCHHKYNDPSGEITHQHHDYETCFVCNLAFGNYIVPVETAFKLHNLDNKIPYFFTVSQKVFYFSQNVYLLRGPPADLVS